MTTPFAARAAKLTGAIDKGFGEQFTFTAMAIAPNGDVNLPKVADGSKPPFTVVGVWEAYADKALPTARGSNPDDEASRRAMQYPSVLVNKGLLTWMPQAAVNRPSCDEKFVHVFERGRMGEPA